jgi:NADH:ubiquinone oxidoreductase subunit E
MPIAETKYYSFEKRVGKFNIDVCLAGVCSFLTISGIIAYFVWEYYEHT